MTRDDNILKLKLLPSNNRLIEARKKKGLSQEKLAELCHLSVTTINRIETLKYIPPEKTKLRIAVALEQLLDDIFPPSLDEAISEGVFSKDKRVKKIREPEVISLIEATRSNLLPVWSDDPADIAEESSMEEKRHEEIHKALETLTPKEREVIKLRFGFDGNKGLTLDQIARRTTGMRGGYVTKEGIRGIEARALRKLRHPTRSRKLKDYLD